MNDTKEEEDIVFEIIQSEESCFLEERSPVVKINIFTEW